MKLLETLTRAADEEQLRLHPLPEHAATQQAEHLRRHYALLLTAVLTAQLTVSESQTRLLCLLLDALKLGDIRGSLFDQARTLEPEPLLEAARLIREAGFAQHFVLDALVLLRLDAPLGDDSIHLVGELAAFLGLDVATLTTRVEDAMDILGLNGSKVDDSNTRTEDITAEKPAQLAELWPAYLSQPLTAAALRAGLHGGLWLLNSDLDVDFPWQANDAIFIFRNGATLNTFAKEGEIEITGCRLLNAALDFQGNCSVTLERCEWRGNYDPSTKRTALNSIGQALTVADCKFSTLNARTISVQDSYLKVTESRFIHCGHAELNGGAIWHSDHSREIHNCYFKSCLAAHGGAIFVNKLYDISQSEFVACESLALQSKHAGDIAIYSNKTHKPKSVSNCIFRKTSLSVGSADPNSFGNFLVYKSQLQSANIYYHSKSFGTDISYGCSFDNGCEMEKAL